MLKTLKLPSLSRKRRKSVLVSLALTLAILTVITIYYSRMEDRVVHKETLYKYTHIAQYNCTALLKPNILYNRTTMPVDEAPIYIPILRGVNVTLTYTVEGADIISGRANISVILECPERWEKTLYTTTLDLTGRELAFTYTLNYTEIKTLINKVSEETGSKASKYIIKLSPTIIPDIIVRGLRVRDSVTPEFKLTIDYSSNRISANSLYMETPREKTITRYEWVESEILGYRVRVSSIKQLLYLSLPTLTIFLTILYIKWGILGVEESTLTRIYKKYRDLIIEVDAPVEAIGVTVKVRDIRDLVKISTNSGKPILFYRADHNPERSAFMVLTDNATYFLELKQ